MRGYKKAYKRAFPYTIPVLTGYLFIGIAFGVMFAEVGYNFLWAALMSLLVFAGSGQYLAVNFFVPGFSFVQVIFLTLMVNIRHIFYGVSLLEKFKGMGKRKWYMVFGLTDGTQKSNSRDNWSGVWSGMLEHIWCFAICITSYALHHCSINWW